VLYHAALDPFARKRLGNAHDGGLRTAQPTRFERMGVVGFLANRVEKNYRAQFGFLAKAAGWSASISRKVWSSAGRKKPV
jgi:hypothetical protein